MHYEWKGFLCQGWVMKNEKENSQKRAYISIHWKCCKAFSRIYKNRDGSAYEGRCPRCAAHLRVPICKGGTTQRIFIAQ